MGRQVIVVDVDVHEPRSMLRRLRELGACVRVVPLPVGDYRTADVLIERKTVRDLHLTLTAGRLWGQLRRLRAAAPRPILVVEGLTLDAGPLSPAAIRGALLAVSENGVKVVRSESEADSVLWLHRIASRASGRPVPRERPIYAQRPKSTTPTATAEAVLAAIPGISHVSARAALERFGNLQAIVLATDAELMSVPGIGAMRARNIRAAVRHRHVAYRSRPRRERPGLST